MLRILHLSDIHFGQETHGEVVYHDDVRKQLLADLRKLLGTTKSLDLILVNGDVAYSGKRSQYDSAVKWLEEIAEVGHCDETHVHTIPGNHDVELDQISLAGKLAQAQLRTTALEAVYPLLHAYTQEKPELNSLFPKLQTYIEFARGYDCDFEALDVPRWTKIKDLGNGVQLRLIGMCSVLVSDLADRKGTMILGNKQYIFPEDNSLLTLVLLHHPLAWLMDEPMASPYITRRSAILLTGHEHLPELNKVTSLNGTERMVISAGAITATKSDGLFEFAYNLIELQIDPADKELDVTVWPRVWNGKVPGFIPDIAKTGGPESKTLSLRIAVEPTTSNLTVGKSHSPASENTMTFDDDAEFGKIKHVFWHYLTWQQRISVLVKSSLWPEESNTRLPQTLELELLQRARDARMLETVWDQMMALLPAERKRPNPFRREAR